jgi:N-acetylglucosamine kinase-like BadF-type ATPase
MKIIADSGATKANWAAVEQGEIIQQIQTQGISPYFLSDEGISEVVLGVRKALPGAVNEVHFYSTGCKALEQRQRVAQLFNGLFPDSAVIKVETDMLGAARALSQHNPGIVCILGTGSNACRYDGKDIVETAGGLGFILGDEGSGAAIGKDLIMAYLNQELSSTLNEELTDEYHLTRDNILQSVYQLPYPNRFLATFAPFVSQHRDLDVFQQLLRRQFQLFFQHSVLVQANCHTLPIHFVGSIAYHFQAEILAVAQFLDLQIGEIVQDPIPGLVAYHLV